MGDKYAYTVVGFCPEQVRSVFEKIKIDNGIPKNSPFVSQDHIVLMNYPHFAVKRTFFLKENTSEEKLIKDFTGLQHKVLEVEFDKVDVFRDTPYGPTLFLSIKTSDRLSDLHRRIVDLFDNIVDTKNPEHELNNYRAHVSFSYGIPLEKIEKVSEKLNRELSGTSFKCQELYLLKEVRDGETDERVILSKLILSR